MLLGSLSPSARKFPVMQDTIACGRMQRPLEGNGLVRPRSFVKGDGGHHRLEIEIAGGRTTTIEQTCEIGDCAYQLRHPNVLTMTAAEP